MLEKLKFCLAHPWTEERNALLCFSLHLQGGQGVDDSFLYLAVFRNVLWSAVALDKTFL